MHATTKTARRKTASERKRKTKYEEPGKLEDIINFGETNGRKMKTRGKERQFAGRFAARDEIVGGSRLKH